jgi:hypothetical protein
MKKTIIIFGVVLFASFILTSCGPNACDCLDVYEWKGWDISRGAGNNITPVKPQLTEDCIKKYGNDIPDSYRGTDKFSDEMKKILIEKCNR